MRRHASWRPTDGQADWGGVYAFTAVQADVTGPALAALLAETRRLSDGVSADEVVKAFSSERTDTIETAGTRSSLAWTLAQLAGQGRGPDALRADHQAAAKVDAATASARARLPVDAAVIVVVGDLSVIRGAVEQAHPGAWEVMVP